MQWTLLPGYTVFCLKTFFSWKLLMNSVCVEFLKWWQRGQTTITSWEKIPDSPPVDRCQNPGPYGHRCNGDKQEFDHWTQSSLISCQQDNILNDFWRDSDFSEEALVSSVCNSTIFWIYRATHVTVYDFNETTYVIDRRMVLKVIKITFK